MKINLQAIQAFEKRYRTAFINSLTGFKSLNLVGTISESGQENLAVFSQIFHLGAQPPLIGMIVRPHSTARHTLENILETGYYTLNHVTASTYQQAHQTSARYDREQSEFEQAGFQPHYETEFKAPFVAESPVRIGMKLEETTTLAINNTVLVIGSIQLVLIDNEGFIQQDGFIDLEQAGSLTSSGLDSYHTTTRLARLPYAKPKP